MIRKQKHLKKLKFLATLGVLLMVFLVSLMGHLQFAEKAGAQAIMTDTLVNVDDPGASVGRNDMALAPDGSYVVIYRKYIYSSPSPRYSSIFAQRFDSSGNKICFDGTSLANCPDDGDENNGLEPEFLVNPTVLVYTNGESTIAINSSGEYVIVWTTYSGTSDHDVYARRFDNSGPLGAEFLVNDYMAGYQRHPAVAISDDGSFVISWQSGDQNGVIAKHYDANGNEISPPAGVQGSGVGNEFQANEFTDRAQYYPDAAMDANGNFIIIWLADNIINNVAVYAKRYDSAGNELCQDGTAAVNCPDDADDGNGVEPEFLVPSSYGIRSSNPGIDMNASGDFVVTWEDFDREIFARKFNNNGVPFGNDFPVNLNISNTVYSLDIDMNNSGEFLIAWQMRSEEIMAQRFDANTNAVCVDGQALANCYDDEYLHTGIWPVYGVNDYIFQTQQTPTVGMMDSGDWVTVWSGTSGGPSNFGVYSNSTPQDSDGDRIFDNRDICPFVSDLAQTDTDRNGDS